MSMRGSGKTKNQGDSTESSLYPELYSEPHQKSEQKHFAKNSQQLKALNHPVKSRWQHAPLLLRDLAEAVCTNLKKYTNARYRNRKKYRIVTKYMDLKKHTNFEKYKNLKKYTNVKQYTSAH